MAVPKRKVTPAVRNMRRAHDRLKTVSFQECTHCGEWVAPHHVCGHCGHYRDKPVLTNSKEPA